MGVAAVILAFGGCISAEDVQGTVSGAGGSSSSMSAGTGEGSSDEPLFWRPGGVEPVNPNDPKIDVALKCSVEWSENRDFRMSADDSNSMGSPGYAREMLMTGAGSGMDVGMAPDPDLIRTYEFLNYYNVAYDLPEDGELAIIPHMMRDAVTGQFRLQVGVQAPPPEASRRAMTVTIVVDTSQSMAGQSIRNAKAVVREIARGLRSGDRVSLVTLDVDAKPMLEGRSITGQSDIDAVAGEADELFVGGGFDLQGGLVRGYSLAHDHYTDKGINRLVLVTDGRTNPTTVNEQFIAEHAQIGEKKGIYLVGVGTGPAEGYNDALLNKLTDAGRGAYVYIDTEAEAHKIFSARFSEVMEIAARSVAVSITLPFHFKLQHFYGEELGFDMSVIEPQHLAPGDAMVFNMTTETCANNAASPEGELMINVEWETPFDRTKRSKPLSVQIGKLLLSEELAPMRKANAVIAYAEALKSLDSSRVALALELVTEASAAASKDEDLKEIKGLLQRYPTAPKMPPPPDN